MKIRMKSASGFDRTHTAGPTTAAPHGLPTTTPGSAGSLVVVTTPEPTNTPRPPKSRRAAAAPAHTTGATPGESPPLPPPNHATTPAPTPRTEPDTATTGAEADEADRAEAAGAAADNDGGCTTGSAATGSAGESDDDTTDEETDGETTEPTVTGAFTGGTSEDAGLFSRWRVFVLPEVPVAEEMLAPTELAEPSRARELPRGVAVVDAAEPEEAPAALEPVDPGDPVVSANATGIEAITEPTPNATASAPTRPITPANAMSAARRRAAISMDSTALEACSPEPMPIEAITTLLD